jgi:hypothetical protein
MNKEKNQVDENKLNNEIINNSVVDSSFKSEKSFREISKKITINRYLLNKLLNFFTNLIQNLDIDSENKKTMFSLISLVKTDENKFTYEKNFENEKFIEIKNLNEKYQLENEVLKKSMKEEQEFNSKLLKDVNNFN